MARHSREEFLENGRWKCISCGDCCRLVRFHPHLRELGWDRGDGTCVKLGADGLCTIYETRPEGCRVKIVDNPRDSQDPHAYMAAACALARDLVKLDSE